MEMNRGQRPWPGFSGVMLCDPSGPPNETHSLSRKMEGKGAAGGEFKVIW